jgi:nicotinamidase-related amidase
MVDADPYPWPYDGPVVGSRLALVVAGAQRAWQRRSLGSAPVAEVIAAVADAVRLAGGLVVHLRHGSAAGGPVALPPAREHPDWALVSDPIGLDLVVDAAGIDGFFGGPLDRVLRSRRVDTLVLAGYGTETAVGGTLRSANDRGYECLTLTDGVAPFGAETGRSTLHSITMSGGIFGAVAPSAALLTALHLLSEPTPAEALR